MFDGVRRDKNREETGKGEGRKDGEGDNRGVCVRELREVNAERRP